jgi:hypothetical protein
VEEYRAYFLGIDGHFNGYEPLICAQDRISEWATDVRQQAALLPPGRERDELLKKLRHAEQQSTLKTGQSRPVCNRRSDARPKARN